jgi:hypothetical protein
MEDGGEMKVQGFKTDSRDALLSLYMFFLEKEGFKVIYEKRGDKMSGGKIDFENFVGAIFLAFVFFIAINIKFPQNSAELHKALNKAAKDPESVVTGLIKNNTDDLLKAQEIIEDFGVDRVNEIEDNDYKIEDDITDILNHIFQNNNKEKIIEGVINVGAKAMKILEHSSNTGAVAAGVNTMESPTRTYLAKYIENYNSTFTDEEMPVARKMGGSKTKGQKRKIVESKRKRGGSKKQKRRSHKRK